MNVVLIGYGAIGQAICHRLQGSTQITVTHVVVRGQRVNEVNAALTAAGNTAQAVATVPHDAKVLLECAGHEALTAHILGALKAGCECAIMSIGALAASGLPELLGDAAHQGRTQVHLLSGAVGGIDALAAARQAGLAEVTYTGRKPPQGWIGSAAETLVNLAGLKQATVIFEGTARQAALAYPKNANVSATVAIAGLGLDATRVCLIADPDVLDNIHEVSARGEFGEMHITLRGKPLASNPKTSALTVLSALRFLHNRASGLTI